jgi:hypothetical protein
MSRFFYSLNAGAHRPERATRAPVRCSGLIMIEAPSSAYHHGMLAVGQSTLTKEGGDLRRFYPNPHKLYCGLDLHARSM